MAPFISILGTFKDLIHRNNHFNKPVVFYLQLYLLGYIVDVTAFIFVMSQLLNKLLFIKPFAEAEELCFIVFVEI